MRVRRLLPPPPPQATSRSADSSPVQRRMTFWRKQLTAWQRRENLPASRSSVKQETRPPDACRAGATCLELQVASRRLSLSASWPCRPIANQVIPHDSRGTSIGGRLGDAGGVPHPPRGWWRGVGGVSAPRP